MSEFKVGDKVEITEIQNGSNRIGEIGTLIKIDIDDDEVPYLVKFEVGSDWWHREGRIKKVSSTKTQTTKENNMNISDNILTVFEKSEDAKKVANRFGDQYGNTDRDLLALKRDKKDLLAIIKDEEEAEKE